MLTAEVGAINARHHDRVGINLAWIPPLRGTALKKPSAGENRAASLRGSGQAGRDDSLLGRTAIDSTAADCYGSEGFAAGSVTWVSLGVELVFSQRQRVAAARVIRPRKRKPE